MYDNDLKLLFTEEEYNQLLLFMLENNHFWLGKEKNYCQVCFVQEFMNSAFKGLDSRLADIIEICVEKYPQILGLVKEEL